MKQFKRTIRVGFLSVLLLPLWVRVAAGQTETLVTLVAGGDVEWSRVTYQPDVYFDNPEPGSGEWIGVPYSNNSENRAFLSQTYTRILESPESHHLKAIHYPLSFDSEEEMARYPFARIAPVLQPADLVFINLETPLSESGRWRGAFRTPSSFAAGLRWVGVDVANIANNHALDAEGEGLLDTIATLGQFGIGKIGAGTNLKEATRPFLVERKGIRFAFLGYTQFENSGTSAFAQDGVVEAGRENFTRPERSGVAPLDPFLIKKNIAAIRDQVDYVIVSFHWGIENSRETHPAARLFAKDIIDAGADVILGHHPHVPRGVEIYRERPIFYCLGNLVFGHNHTYWGDNYLARLSFSPEAIRQIEILPIAGSGQALAQPFLLEGESARTVLEDIRERSALLDTELIIEDNVGVIRLGPSLEPHSGSKGGSP